MEVPYNQYENHVGVTKLSSCDCSGKLSGAAYCTITVADVVVSAYMLEYMLDVDNNR
jgi:hypothetical protein